MGNEAASSLRGIIDPQQADALVRNAEIMAGLGGTGKTLEENRERAEAARGIWNQGGPVIAMNEARTIPGPFRDVPVQFYRTDEEASLPVFVYLHGGGFRIGGPRSNDLQMRQLVEDWRGAVISADYLHVPEHVFPDPVDEIVAILEWISANGSEWNLDGKRIAIGGASAGASVALGSALTLRDKGRGELLSAVASLYGVLDYNLKSDSMNEFGGGDFIFTNTYIQMVYDGYVTKPADRTNPLAFAIYADPAGLPPILIEAAQLDPIRDDSLNFSKMLTEAGHPNELKIYAGLLHAYFGYSGVIDEARRSVADLAVFLGKHLGPR